MITTPFLDYSSSAGGHINITTTLVWSSSMLVPLMFVN